MNTPDEFLNIDTPENVIFGYEVVGIGSRFMAALVDTLIIIGLQIVLFIGMRLLFGEALGDLANIFIAVYILLAFVLFWGYYIFFELRWNGSSPGKRAVKLRVIQRDGTPITISESIIRNLVRLVDFLPFAYGIGIVTMFIDGHSRRLGDLAANTIVVREQEDVTLGTLDKSSRMAQSRASLRVPGETEALAAEWPVNRLDSADIQLIVDLLDRRNELEDTTRLANQILQKSIIKMELPPQFIRPSEALYALNTIVQKYYQQNG